MTDKTFTFTIEQIKDIYRAGIRRGQEEATAFDWGSTPTGNEFDECVSAIYDIVNEGKDFWADDRIDYNVVEEWFQETK
jgi:hypothetical protein